MIPQDIVFHSAGPFAVAVLALIMTILQALLLLRKPTFKWYGWGAAISLSGVVYAIGIFGEYNTPAGALNRFAGILEFSAIVFLIHCSYGFSFSYLGKKSNRYHLLAGIFHGLILFVLWTTDAIVAQRFVARNLMGLPRPFVEPALGALGPVFVFYGILASIGVILLWARHRDADLRHRTAFLTGLVFWLVLAAHDGLVSMGLQATPYLQESGQRAAAIVQDLLTVARGVAVGREALNLNEVVRDYLSSPEFDKLRQFHPGVAIEDHLDEDLLNIKGSVFHVRKAVMNIDVTSGEDGTRFTLYFPVTRDLVADKAAAVPLAHLRGEGETILVIDDLESQREISCRMLQALGYQTQVVASGEAAVAYLKTHRTDLLLLDMIMDPGIDGRETYARIKQVHPDQKAIIVSGYAETEQVAQTLAMGAGQFLKKPLLLEDLGLAVKRELKRPPPAEHSGGITPH